MSANDLRESISNMVWLREKGEVQQLRSQVCLLERLMWKMEDEVEDYSSYIEDMLEKEESDTAGTDVEISNHASVQMTSACVKTLDASVQTCDSLSDARRTRGESVYTQTTADNTYTKTTASSSADRKAASFVHEGSTSC